MVVLPKELLNWAKISKIEQNKNEKIIKTPEIKKETPKITRKQPLSLSDKLDMIEEKNMTILEKIKSTWEIDKLENKDKLELKKYLNSKAKYFNKKVSLKKIVSLKNNYLKLFSYNLFA